MKHKKTCDGKCTEKYGCDVQLENLEEDLKELQGPRACSFC